MTVDAQNDKTEDLPAERRAHPFSFDKVWIQTRAFFYKRQQFALNTNNTHHAFRLGAKTSLSSMFSFKLLRARDSRHARCEPMRSSEIEFAFDVYFFRHIESLHESPWSRSDQSRDVEEMRTSQHVNRLCFAISLRARHIRDTQVRTRGNSGPEKIRSLGGLRGTTPARTFRSTSTSAAPKSRKRHQDESAILGSKSREKWQNFNQMNLSLRD